MSKSSTAIRFPEIGTEEIPSQVTKLLATRPKNSAESEALATAQQESLDNLFRRYWPQAYVVAYRLVRKEADALDAVQEGFVKVTSKYSSFKGRSTLAAWLLRIVSNEANNLLRKQKRQANVSRRAAERGCAVRSSWHPEYCVADEVMELEAKALAVRLPDTIDQILIEHADELMRAVYAMRSKKMTFRQIATKLACGKYTAQNAMKRVIQLLRRELSARGYSAI